MSLSDPALVVVAAVLTVLLSVLLRLPRLDTLLTLLVRTGKRAELLRCAGEGICGRLYADGRPLTKVRGVVGSTVVELKWLKLLAYGRLGTGGRESVPKKAARASAVLCVVAVVATLLRVM